MRGNVIAYPNLEIYWPPGSNNYVAQAPIMGFQWGIYMADGRVNWSTIFVNPYQLGNFEAELQGLTPGGQYSYRAFLAVSEIKYQYGGDVYAPATQYYGEVITFTVSQ